MKRGPKDHVNIRISASWLQSPAKGGIPEHTCIFYTIYYMPYQEPYMFMWSFGALMKGSPWLSSFSCLSSALLSYSIHVYVYIYTYQYVGVHIYIYMFIYTSIPPSIFLLICTCKM